MTYWQIMPDRRWTRFDVGDIALLVLIACVLFSASRVRKPEATWK